MDDDREELIVCVDVAQAVLTRLSNKKHFLIMRTMSKVWYTASKRCACWWTSFLMHSPFPLPKTLPAYDYFMFRAATRAVERSQKAYIGTIRTYENHEAHAKLWRSLSTAAKIRHEQIYAAAVPYLDRPTKRIKK